VRSTGEGLFERAVQGVEQLADGDLVDAGAMLEGLQVGDLALVAVQVELLEYGQGFGMLPDDIGDNHVFGDHAEHLVVSVDTAVMYIGQGSPYLARSAVLTSGGTNPSMLPFSEQTSLTMEDER